VLNYFKNQCSYLSVLRDFDFIDLASVKQFDSNKDLIFDPEKPLDCYVFLLDNFGPTQKIMTQYALNYEHPLEKFTINEHADVNTGDTV